MFKIIEYKPDQEGNFISIRAGNLSFAGKSFGMSVHLLPGTCTGFQQLLTGNARRGAAPSQPGPAAPTAQAVALHPGKQGNRLPFKETESQGLGHLSGTYVEPFPARLGDQDCRLWQCVPSQGCRHLFCPHRDCRIHKIRKDPKYVPGNIVLGCSRRRHLTCKILLLYMVTDGQHLTKKEKNTPPHLKLKRKHRLLKVNPSNTPGTFMCLYQITVGH